MMLIFFFVIIIYYIYIPKFCTLYYFTYKINLLIENYYNNDIDKSIHCKKAILHNITVSNTILHYLFIHFFKNKFIMYVIK